MVIARNQNHIIDGPIMRATVILIIYSGAEISNNKTRIYMNMHSLAPAGSEYGWKSTRVTRLLVYFTRVLSMTDSSWWCSASVYIVGVD